jgi:hypothetical protein
MFRQLLAFIPVCINNGSDIGAALSNLLHNIPPYTINEGGCCVISSTRAFREQESKPTESSRYGSILLGERQICWVLGAFRPPKAPTDDLTICVARGQFVGKL